MTMPLLAEDIEVQTVKLVRITPEGGATAPLDARSRARSALRRRLPFVVLVALPTLLSAFYFFALAAPRYVSEIKFVVRTPSSAASSELATIVSGSGAGVMRSTDDAYIAKEYILSRDAMDQLVAHENLLGIFAKAGFDVLWRYPKFFGKGNSDALEKQYERFVEVDYDHSSGISTLSAQGFEPEDAQRLADALLGYTEKFLNGLNLRAQNDAVQGALTDVELAKKRSYEALDAVTTFRNRETIVDPTLSSTSVVQGISALSLEMSTTNTRLADLLTNTPQSPEIATLRSRAAALQLEITKQRQLLGGNSGSLAPRIAEYQRLLLDQQFADKAFTSALASLESARVDASRQRVFLERVTTPDLPDAPTYPYRLTGVLITLGASFGIWRIVNAVQKDTQEHHKR